MLIDNIIKEWGEKITLLVTPHDDYRYPYLYRFLQYYESFDFPFNIYILNSCPSKIDEKIFARFLKNDKIHHYEFTHETSMFQKIVDGLSLIKSEYGVICSEDDFITPKGIKESVFFLEKNPDYSVAIGAITLFTRNEDTPLKESSVTWNVVSNNASSIESENPAERVVGYFKNFVPIYFAITRTDILRSVWNEASQNLDDYRFGELLPAFLTIVYGKLKFIDVLYTAREYMPNSQGQSIEDFNDFLKAGTYRAKYKTFRNCLAGPMMKYSGLNEKEVKSIIDKGMRAYLGFSSDLFVIKYHFRVLLKRIGFLSIAIILRDKFLAINMNSKPVNSNVTFWYKHHDNFDYEQWKKLDELIASPFTFFSKSN